MYANTQTRSESADARLQKQVPPPSNLRNLLSDNRRERILLRRLLTLSECIYAATDSSSTRSEDASQK